MGLGGELLFAAVMLLGLAGTVVPGLPGLPVIWGAAVVWALLEDGTGRWVVLAAVTVPCLVGGLATAVLPARSLQRTGAPRRTLVAAGAGAVVGFFVIPVAGVVVGAVAAVLAAELHRLRDPALAWRSTLGVLRAVGLGIVVELGAAAVAVGAWGVGALVTA